MFKCHEVPFQTWWHCVYPGEQSLGKITGCPFEDARDDRKEQILDSALACKSYSFFLIPPELQGFTFMTYLENRSSLSLDVTFPGDMC